MPIRKLILFLTNFLDFWLAILASEIIKKIKNIYLIDLTIFNTLSKWSRLLNSYFTIALNKIIFKTPTV